MDRQPVDDIRYWRERLRLALRQEVLNYSVYLLIPEKWRKVEKAHKNIIEMIIRPHERVLDAGCGYGRLSEHIDNYIGVDFSPDFIEKAHELYPEKTFFVADLRNLPFADKEFDWAVCASVRGMIIGNMSQEVWNQMEAELKRVAHEVIILEYIDSEDYEIL